LLEHLNSLSEWCLCIPGKLGYHMRMQFSPRDKVPLTRWLNGRSWIHRPAFFAYFCFRFQKEWIEFLRETRFNILLRLLSECAAVHRSLALRIIDVELVGSDHISGPLDTNLVAIFTFTFSTMSLSRRRFQYPVLIEPMSWLWATTCGWAILPNRRRVLNKLIAQRQYVRGAFHPYSRCKVVSNYNAKADWFLWDTPDLFDQSVHQIQSSVNIEQIGHLAEYLTQMNRLILRRIMQKIFLSSAKSSALVKSHTAVTH
jgi:hypothetical protein